MSQSLRNRHVAAEIPLATPGTLREALPISPAARETVSAGRAEVEAILDRSDSRLLVVVGPCSIHDERSALDYAQRLLSLREQVRGTMALVMRVYFEKPRTTVGWKGFINDPHLNDSFQINEGLHRARALLLELAELGMPTGTEALDPISPQYLSELFSWSAIGARTTESQTHREMSSGLSMAVGFKNGTDGNLDVAINAMRSAATPHRFLGINAEGQVTIIETTGNPWNHVILRGGAEPNYDAAHVNAAAEAISSAGLPPRIMVDCSHGNSNKDHERQPDVAREVVQQVLAGNEQIVGLMLESHIKAGHQKLDNPATLEYGCSITDACIDWPTTASLLLELDQALKKVKAA